MWLWVLIVVLAGLLTVASSATLGRKLGDIEYQRAAHINGIFRIQAYINARTHANRVWMGVVFLIVSLVPLGDIDPFWRTWISRVLFISMLGSYTVSSVLDWLDEHRMMKLQLAAMPPTPQPTGYSSSQVSLQANSLESEGVSP